MKTNIQALHQRALQAVKTYHTAEADLIDILQEMNRCRGYRELGYKSLYEYAQQGLNLSENVSCHMIAVARKSEKVPALKEMMRAQEIHLTNARMIAPILTPENQDKWLEKAANLSKMKLEKEIRMEHPQAVPEERVRYLTENRMKLELAISEELHAKLKRVQDLVSSRLGHAASLEEALNTMADLYLEREDPLEKAKRAQARFEKKSDLARQNPAQSKTGVAQSQAQPQQPAPSVHSPQVDPAPSKVDLPFPGMEHTGRTPIPASLIHEATLRDQAQCTHLDPSGNRCTSRRWLDLHHIVLVSQGGKNTLENLTTLCRAHHQMLHQAH